MNGRPAAFAAALPPALNVVVLASQCGARAEPASSAVVVGAAASFVTVTGRLALIVCGGRP